MAFNPDEIVERVMLVVSDLAPATCAALSDNGHAELRRRLAAAIVGPRNETPEGIPVEAVQWMRRGNKIDAIKVVRRERGLDLKTAKDLVESVWDEYGPGDQPRIPARDFAIIIHPDGTWTKA